MPRYYKRPALAIGKGRWGYGITIGDSNRRKRKNYILAKHRGRHIRFLPASNTNYTGACVTIDDSWGQSGIVDIANGTGEGYRTSNVINGLTFSGKGLLSFGSSTVANRVRVIVACIRAGTTPLSTSDIDTTPYGRRDDDLRTVLFDKTYVNIHSSNLLHFNIRCSLKGIGIHYNGATTTSHDRRDLVLMTCSDTAGSDAGIDAHFRTKFSES